MRQPCLSAMMIEKGIVELLNLSHQNIIAWAALFIEAIIHALLLIPTFFGSMKRIEMT